MSCSCKVQERLSLQTDSAGSLEEGRQHTVDYTFLGILRGNEGWPCYGHTQIASEVECTAASLSDHGPPEYHDAPHPSSQASPLVQAGMGKDDYKD